MNKARTSCTRGAVRAAHGQREVMEIHASSKSRIDPCDLKGLRGCVECGPVLVRLSRKFYLFVVAL